MFFASSVCKPEGGARCPQRPGPRVREPQRLLECAGYHGEDIERRVCVNLKRFSAARWFGFPLPSTGRGIEGEGWACREALGGLEYPVTSTPHPCPPPVE